MDINGLLYFIAIATALSGIGISLDKLVLKNQNNVINDWLIIFWDKVDDLKFRDISTSLVEKYLRFEVKFFGKTLSLRWILTTLVVSVLLTIFTIFIGKSLGIYLHMLCGEMFFNTEPSGFGFRDYMRMGWGWFQGNPNKLKAIGLNYTFDLITLLVTIRLLRKFLATEELFKKYTYILFDILVCILLLQFCLYFGLIIDHSHVRNDSIPTPFHVFPIMVKDLRVSTSEFPCSAFHFWSAAIGYSATILIPTFLYLMLIFFVMLAKTAHDIGKFVLVQILRLGVEGEKTVFYYSGVFLGIMVVILKLIKELISLVIAYS